MKLTWFCRHASYHGGIFLVYGAEVGEAPEYLLLKAKLRGAIEGQVGIDAARIFVLVHSAVNRGAEMVNL